MERLFDFDIREYYTNLHLSRNILYLYASRILMQTGVGMLSVFAAIYFYEQFDYSFEAVMIVFIALYLFTLVLVPLSAMLINKVGIRRLLIVAVLLHPVAYAALLQWDKNETFAVFGFIIAISLYRALYWAPYHIDFAKFTNKKNRGEQMSLLLNISEIFLTITPVVAGVIIAAYSFELLFVIVIFFMIASVFPLLKIEDTREEYSFGYFETFQKLFVKKNRAMVLAYFGDGVQTAVRVAIWPIFIYILLDEQYVVIGLVTAMTMALLVGLRFAMGYMEDHMDRQRLLRFGSFLSTTGWIVKVFIDTGFEIFIADTYHKVGRVVNRMSFDVSTYDQASDNGHYIDEFTVLKDISLGVGRASMLIFSIFLVAWFGIAATFLFAAGATLLMTLLHRDVFIQ